MRYYRDGIELEIDGDVAVSRTRTGHVVEKVTVHGVPKYFVTLKGSHYCAHGATVAEAVADAIWKDPDKRPSLEELKRKIRARGKSRKISLPEFRILTGACKEGCAVAIARARVSGAPMTAYDIRDKVSRDWGQKLLRILEWED